MKVKTFSRVRFSETPWTAAYQVPPSMGFSRREYWSGLPLPSPGDLPTSGTEPGSPALQADSLPSEAPGKPLSLTVVKSNKAKRWPDELFCRLASLKQFVGVVV